MSGILSHLPKIVEVVLPVDPAIRRTFVDAIRLVLDGSDIRAIAEIERTFEQLTNRETTDTRYTPHMTIDNCIPMHRSTIRRFDISASGFRLT